MTTTLEVELDEETKEKAEQVLSKLRLSPAHAIAMLYEFIAEEEDMPFAVPNEETIASIEAGRRGDVVSFNRVEDLIKHLEDEED